MHLPLGFPRPPNPKTLRLGWFPDLTGGFEPVELLSVRRRPAGRVIGFLVVYEHRDISSWASDEGTRKASIVTYGVSPPVDGHVLWCLTALLVDVEWIDDSQVILILYRSQEDYIHLVDVVVDGVRAELLWQ